MFIRSLALSVALYGGNADAALDGCHPPYSGAGNYADGDEVSAAVQETESVQVENKNVDKTVFNRYNFACHEPVLCNSDGYEPAGIHSTLAWTEVGKCTTSKPAVAKAPPPAWDGVGCPQAYSSGGDYVSGDVVSVAKSAYTLVYQCVSGDNGLFCSIAGYNPGEGIHWSTAWNQLGSCTGTISPTQSPSFETLEGVGGCPDEHVDGADYEEGDRVTVNGFVFSCQGWPNTGYCGQAGFKPLDISHDDAWKLAWTIVGYCSGTISPTSSPVYVALENMGGCPDEWKSSGEYEEDDKVAVTVSTAPIRKVVYKCKAWPWSGHCANRAPLEHGGDEAWTLAGSCDGSMGPTASPAFDVLNELEGCPVEYSASVNDYKAGDQVSVIISATPKRALVFECRSWPNTGHCNQAAYEPTGKYGSMAWEVKGACTGSLAPTVSPSMYKGTCEFQKCNLGTYKDPCTDGTGGCINGKKSVIRCEYSTEDVENWSSSTTYEAGDVVRLGLNRYRCKGHPFTGWCSRIAYNPGSDNWASAWTKDGICAPPQPTGGPTTSPTKSPTSSPTENPTSSPALSPTKSPTSSPTKSPTSSPTKNPTSSPTTSPTAAPIAPLVMR